MPSVRAAKQKQRKLTAEQIHNLVIDSRGKENLREVLKRFGDRSNKDAVTTIVSCKNGRAQGSWGIAPCRAENPDLKVRKL